MIDLNGVRLRNRVVTSSSLLGYGAPRGRLVLYGLSPFAQWVPLERFGAVTTRTLRLEPREGHFTLREDWRAHEMPELLRALRAALRRVDAGWLNAFGWSNIGIEAYFRDYFPKTHHLNRIVSVGGFSADEFCALVDVVNAHARAGRDRRRRVQRLVPQRELPVRDDPRGRAGAGGAAQPPPGAPEAVARLRLRAARATRRTLWRGRPGGDEHGQGLATGPAHGRAAAEEPLRRAVGSSDQADRAARRVRAARGGHRAADHGQRRGPLASTTVASTSGQAPTRSAWAARSGWRRTGATPSGRCADCGFNGSSDAWRGMSNHDEVLGRDLVADGSAAGRLSPALGRTQQLLHR